MSCSKNAATKYLIDKNLIKSNMELYTQLPTQRLSSTIARLTSLAKNKYGVDMGSLFSLKFREVSTGNYLTEGSRAVITKIKVEPNDAAFDAIDRSSQKKRNDENIIINRYRYETMGEVSQQYKKIEEEGNFIVSETGSTVVPTSLPQINIQC